MSSLFREKNKKMNIYYFHSDACKGWLQVHKKDIPDGMEISENSYEHKDCYYLDEDSDMPLFVSLKGEVNIVDYPVCTGDHIIRTYDRVK